MPASQALNVYHESLELVDRFAQCLLKDCKTENDLLVVKQLGSFILHFSNEIEMNSKRDKIFENLVSKIDSATEKPDCDDILNEYQKECEKAIKQLSNNRSVVYMNFMKMISEKDLTDGAEIETVSETVSNIDPISKLPIVEPVKNKICGHTYDKTSMMQLIEQNPRTRCPIPGCNAANYVRKSDLIPNSTFKRILDNANSNSPKKFKIQ